MKQLTEASVVIPAYGQSPFIKDTIGAIRRGRLQPAEIIVSHSGSHDPTEMLRRFDPGVMVLHSPARLFAGAARNRGASRARSGVLVFCDSDVLPATDWLENLIEALDGDRNRFVVGSIGAASPGGYWGMSNWLCEFSEQAPWRPAGPQAGGASCNMAVRKADFERVGAFDESMTPGEDTLLFHRLRHSDLEQWFAPAAHVGHFNQTGFRAFFDHQLSLGRNFAKVRRMARMKGTLAVRFPVLALGLWLPKSWLVVRRTLSDGARGWLRVAIHLPAIVLGSWIWTAGCLRGIFAANSPNGR